MPDKPPFRIRTGPGWSQLDRQARAMMAIVSDTGHRAHEYLTGVTLRYRSGPAADFSVVWELQCPVFELKRIYDVGMLSDAFDTLGQSVDAEQREQLKPQEQPADMLLLMGE